MLVCVASDVVQVFADYFDDEEFNAMTVDAKKEFVIDSFFTKDSEGNFLYKQLLQENGLKEHFKLLSFR